MTKFNHATQESLLINSSKAGKSRKDIVAEFVAKGLTEKQATKAVAYHAEMNDVSFHTNAASGWREASEAFFTSSPFATKAVYKKHLLESCPKLTEKRLEELVRYHYDLITIPLRANLKKHGITS